MSILVDKNTRLLVQGITGKEGLFHSELMRTYGTNIVAGVTPGKGGEWVLDEKIPVFDTVQTAVQTTEADASVIFVPAKFAFDSIYEAIDAHIPLIICITEGIPAMDMLKIKSLLKTSESILIGPNTPGVLTPGECKAGIIPGNISIPGSTGMISRSGTLTYEVLYAMKAKKLGVSTCVGIGGDAITGTSFIEMLSMFEQDPDTEEISSDRGNWGKRGRAGGRLYHDRNDQTGNCLYRRHHSSQRKTDGACGCDHRRKSRFCPAKNRTISKSWCKGSRIS